MPEWSCPARVGTRWLIKADKPPSGTWKSVRVWTQTWSLLVTVQATRETFDCSVIFFYKRKNIYEYVKKILLQRNSTIQFLHLLLYLYGTNWGLRFGFNDLAMMSPVRTTLFLKDDFDKNVVEITLNKQPKHIQPGNNYILTFIYSIYAD